MLKRLMTQCQTGERGGREEGGKPGGEAGEGRRVVPERRGVRVEAMRGGGPEEGRAPGERVGEGEGREMEVERQPAAM